MPDLPAALLSILHPDPVLGKVLFTSSLYAPPLPLGHLAATICPPLLPVGSGFHLVVAATSTRLPPGICWFPLLKPRSTDFYSLLGRQRWFSSMGLCPFVNLNFVRPLRIGCKRPWRLYVLLAMVRCLVTTKMLKICLWRHLVAWLPRCGVCACVWGCACNLVLSWGPGCNAALIL
jgi:hypothetical protein